MKQIPVESFFLATGISISSAILRTSGLEILPCTAKFRYRSKDVPVKLMKIDDNNWKVSYKDMTTGVTPGQACVLYDGEVCLGSGIINEIYKREEKLWYLTI